MSKKTTPNQPAREDLEVAVADWRKNPTAGHLGEVLAFFIASDCVETVAGVAKEAIDAGFPLTKSQRAVASSLLGDEDEENDNPSVLSICNPHIQNQVRVARALLRTNPANPLVLLDLAQLQLASGKRQKAERSLLSSLSLSPNNRIILRTLARFYVHTGDFERAHNLIASHRRSQTDPWLMASEIALSEVASVPSRFVKYGAKLAGQKEFRRSDVSELAGAVGGIELLNGKHKRARDFFRIALLEPNDNVIAQAITDQKSLALDLTQPNQRQVARNAAEARTLISWNSIDVETAEQNALRWHAEEPFSSRPLQFISSIYSIIRRPKEGAMLARRGLIADPKNTSLMANLAYALACEGEFSDAEYVARRMASLDDHYRGHSLATLGLISMKQGRVAEGDALYRQALELFVNRKNYLLASVCQAYYARAAFDTDHPDRIEILKSAVECYEKHPSQEAALILKLLNAEVESPPSEEPVRRLGQWIFDAEHNLLIRKEGVTEIGAPPLIIKPK